MRSPITGKEMKIVKELTTLSFRKDEFQILYHYYLCEETNEHFTDDRLDNINIIQVHNQYIIRMSYKLLFMKTNHFF